MAPAHFKGIFPPSEERMEVPASGGLGNIFKDSFSLPTLLALGGLAQGVLSLVLPARYGLLPLLFLLLRSLVVTVLAANSLDAYVAKCGVIRGRTSGQLPNASYDGEKSSSLFGTTPSDKEIVVFHLGARFNHPLGPLAPKAKDLGDQFNACNADLLERAKEFGCIGASAYRGDDASSHNTIMTIYYFRNLEGLNRFAHDDIHRRAWDWYNRECLRRGYTHLGIFHEAFVVPAGAYETLYVNMQPTLLAQCQTDVRNESTGTDEFNACGAWITLAIHGKLAI
ncbi:hypothetical protein C7999DRAFT_43320 [Corynascus novoguineensis]|uniref:Monooxygenase n=1 Tax=Corynascus novoguineensis TaxID=1126955 RepID=A0AAN7CN38_9PEZI|nr:hypothetical protein C7999DRAFT_43320 [Corynascus novoguineensis]